MQPAIVKTSFVDSSNGNAKKMVEFTRKKPLVCPKPRRPVSSIPEVLEPLRCTKHCRFSCSPNNDWKSDILKMIDNGKVNEPSSCIACCTAKCYSGSPPGRTDNPLIHDDHFMNQMNMFSPYTKTLP